MNELLAAAKAVIDRWDLSKMYVESPIMDELRAAVERAEKQEVVGFDEWWERVYGGRTCKEFAKHAWKTNQQVERERIKDLLRQSDDWFEEDQMAQAKWLPEKIDGD